MSPRFPSVRLAAALSILVASSAQAAIPASERQVLLDLHTNTNGAGWTTSTNWNGAPGTECTWFGVTCDAGENTVTQIDLSSNNLVGTLPGNLNDLTNLTSFQVDGNALSGPIPTLAGLTQLVTFFAHDNQLSGSIPSLAGLTSLATFYVQLNELSGTIPPLSGLSNLAHFDVHGNQLTGTIPSDINTLTTLTSFIADHNQLSGGIPALAGLTNLANFFVHANQLTGAIPSLAGLTNLGWFLAGSNQLSGSIPSLAGLTNLAHFYVDNNQLTGSIPPLTGLTNLTYFRVQNNQLSGDPPAVPSPNGLLPGASRLCPNDLNLTPDPAWDTATGETPWYTACMPGTPPVLFDIPDQTVTVGTPHLVAVVAYAMPTESDSFTGYSIASGTLPPGLTLDGGLGVISGTPTTPGVYDVSVTVSDKDGASNADAIRFFVQGTGGPDVQAIPALSAGGLALTSLCLALAGGLSRRRRGT